MSTLGDLVRARRHLCAVGFDDGPFARGPGAPVPIARGLHSDDDPAIVGAALATLTDRGKVPEPLRLAHLIGAAVVTGQSGRRA